MGNNMLRAPLIKSAVLLTVFSLLVYLTASSPDGSVWSSLGEIFLAVFKAAQLGVGLFLALALCFMVLAVIFIGGLALVSKESAAKLFDQCCQSVSGKLSYLKSLIRKDGQPSCVISLDELGLNLKSEISSELRSSVESLRSAQGENAVSLAGMQSRVTELTAAVSSTQEDLRQLHEKVEQVIALSQQASENPAIAELSQQVKDVERLAEEGKATVSDLQHQVRNLHDDLAEIRASAAVEEIKPSEAVAPQSDEGTHRLFSYIDDPAVRKKIDQLVTETLKQDMTLAQVTGHLIDNVGKAAGRILSAHPSLTRDYIRDRRKQG